MRKARPKTGWRATAFLGKCVALAAALSLVLDAPPARAEGVEIIRDAEIEALLRDYATPVFRAAGLDVGAVKVILVGDRSFNAFVANGQKIFINVGALMEIEQKCIWKFSRVGRVELGFLIESA